MTDYTAPQRDISFVLNELLDFEKHCQQIPAYQEVNTELAESIIEEGAKFSERVLAPLYQTGDQGCQYEDTVVTTPPGFKAAYQQYIEAGWTGLTQPEAYGGQNLPHSLGVAVGEMTGTANFAWGTYSGLGHGAMATLLEHGSDDQKSLYLSQLVSGKWTGTMCLTESHCGTDLGMLRTKAEPNDDGTYRLTGTKIFITCGEHDMSDNIVHIVIARIADAPAGTKGISLFIVPKFLPDADGNPGERNGVSCGAIEHKMGIHGSATCVMNFDGATGFMIGEPNKGMSYMFTFMNTARIGTGSQGLMHAERGFQGSLAYAKERLQMRSLSGVKNPGGPADPIIVHPEVRKLLLTQKAIAEGSRALIYYTGTLLDQTHHAAQAQTRQEAEELLGLITPIVKAFITELGFESANHGVQVFGGHGYISEWGMEQNLRDCRIATLYEGTTQIQALDLIGRKVMMDQGTVLRKFTKIIHLFCQENADNPTLQPYVEKLTQLNKEWGDLTMKIGMKAAENRDELGAASVDYLMYAGYVTTAWLWARMVKTAQEALDNGTTEADFYQAKITTADFYYQRILPRTRTLAETMVSGADDLMTMHANHFNF